MNNDVTGFDLAKINAIGGIIDQQAESFNSTITDKFQSQLVEAMTPVWYAPEAREWFQTFASGLYEQGVEIQKLFNKFCDICEENANIWIQATAGSAGSELKANLGDVTPINLTIDVEKYPIDNDGVVGIREAEAQAVADSMPNLQQEITEYLAECSQNLKEQTGFLGHGQDEAVTNLFGRVNEAISKIFSFISEGPNSLKTAIELAIQKYATQAQIIASGTDQTTVNIVEAGAGSDGTGYDTNSISSSNMNTMK